MHAVCRYALYLFGCLTVLALLIGPSPAFAADESEAIHSPLDAFKESEFHLGLRYRFEAVEDDAVGRDAEASTLRTSLFLRTAEYRDVSVTLEVENVAVLGDDDTFRNAGAGSRSNAVVDRPVVADVAQTEFNQAFVQFTPGSLDLRAGRREINFADQRFVGAVGWRQNHQSFDAFSIDGKATDKLSWSYAYIDRVHRIFADSRGMSTHLLAAAFDFGEATVRAYGLELDYDTQFAGASSRTLGAELAGSWSASDRAKLLYEVELATQADTGDNPADVDAGYSHLMAGAKLGDVTVKIGWEVLEGSAADGQFSTPLATLHKFNGWADKFLSTPVAGLEDLYLHLGAGRGRWNCAAIYHQFEAESAATEYGSELDLSVRWKSDWGQQFALKFADYSADDFSTDTTKWMVWSAYTF